MAQNRNRCFCVSVLGGKEGDFIWPEPTELTKCMADYLDEVVDEKYYINSERAQQLYADFCANVKWETMDYADTFYWGSNAQFGAMMKDTARVTTYLKLYERAMRNHAYPLYNSDAAKVAMAAYYLLQF